jgi:hypothetical protein
MSTPRRRQQQLRMATPVLAAARKVPELKSVEEYEKSNFAAPQKTGNWPLDILNAHRHRWVRIHAGSWLSAQASVV